MNNPSTRLSLLLALQSQTPEKRTKAWTAFEAEYRPMILSWCRNFLQQESANAEDLFQDILVKLSRAFSQRSYDPDRGHFRPWLHTVVKRTLLDFSRKRKRELAGMKRKDIDPHTFAAPEDEELAEQLLVADPEQAIAELSNVLADHPLTKKGLAIARVRANVSERDWMVFWRRFAEEQSVAEIAADMGLTNANVYQIAQRVRNAVREEAKHV